LLKLDVAQVMATLDAELGKTDKFSEPPPLTDEPRGALDFVMLQLSKLNWRMARVVLIAAAALLVIVVIVSMVRHHQHADPLSNLGTGVYQPAQPASGETLPVPARRP
jgi:hypothetical protein